MLRLEQDEWIKFLTEEFFLAMVLEDPKPLEEIVHSTSDRMERRLIDTHKVDGMVEIDFRVSTPQLIVMQIYSELEMEGRVNLVADFQKAYKALTKLPFPENLHKVMINLNNGLFSDGEFGQQMHFQKARQEVIDIMEDMKKDNTYPILQRGKKNGNLERVVQLLFLGKMTSFKLLVL
jgi:hypothetical protein